MTVAVASSRDVWATAVSTNPRTRKTSTAFLRWNGSRWRIVRAPAQPSAVAALGSDVWAVGSRNGRPVSMRWSANRWTIVSVPAGAGSLGSVTVAASGDVWAVGEDHAGSVLVLHRSGTRWSRVASPDGAYGATTVAAIPGTGGVWVEASDLAAAPLDLDQWTGSGWQINNLLVPGAAWSIGGPTLAASSATDAWVGVTQGDGAGHFRPWLAHWDGKSWSQTPTPSLGLNSEVNGISVRSATDAWAVGAYRNPLGQLASFVLHWDGTSWTRVGAPAHAHEPKRGRSFPTDNAIAVVPGSNQVWIAGGTLDRGVCH
jgi:hypothetical protein